jgi:hypothetical protein
VADLKALRSSLAGMCDDLIASTGVPFESTSEAQRQVLAVFACGMAFAVGRLEQLTPSEVHALCITLLIDAFKYSPEQAGAFTRALIESAGGEGNPTIRAILQRGIDGHLQWSSGRAAELGENVNSVFHAVGVR